MLWHLRTSGVHFINPFCSPSEMGVMCIPGNRPEAQIFRKFWEFSKICNRCFLWKISKMKISENLEKSRLFLEMWNYQNCLALPVVMFFYDRFYILSFLFTSIFSENVEITIFWLFYCMKSYSNNWITFLDQLKIFKWTPKILKVYV